MPLPATIDVCSVDLFSPECDLRAKYDDLTVARVLRIRDVYTYLLANPESKDKELVDRIVATSGISKSAAYSDLAIVKSLLPMLTKASRDFHRWRANEMFLETYRMAKARKDTKTMERAASAYAKYNRVDLEDEMAIPYEEIVIQPFTATNDPTVLGIKPIPNIKARIKSLEEQYAKDFADIEFIECEEVDLEEDELFNDDDESNEANIL